jgi:CheY-like chemotaxis protein/CHASE3 domain sensor protein/putative methionine-R-sulfoxide reductase with GAF domain
MKQSLTRNLAIGFGFSLLILLASSAASFFSIQNLLNSSYWVNHTYEVISNLNDVVAPIREAESAQRGYLITNDPVFLEPFHGSFEESITALEHVKTLTGDNPPQQVRCERLRELINKRFSKMEALIKSKQEANVIDPKQLTSGKDYMDSIVSLVNDLKNAEKELLAFRTNRFENFSRFTPVLIILSSIIAVLIAIFFYIRVRNDINLRLRLQQELEQKDLEITRRIQTVSKIAETISSGDYSTRINDDEKDNLGSLSSALNKMGASLDYSFKSLSDKEWLQTGAALISEAAIGEQTVEQLSSKVLQVIANYTASSVGAFYLYTGNNRLHFEAGYAFVPTTDRKNISVGDGIIGEVAVTHKEIFLSETTGSPLQISYATGSLKPVSIFGFPVSFENKLIGVIELGSLIAYSERDLQFFRNAANIIAIAINMAQNRERMQELLEEVQAQSEELQAQHKELEIVNTEMEAQTEKLQVSEEELKVQQEELLQTNRELEERSKLLEEKNELIGHRNREIQKKAEELAQSTKYKSEFLANMSHELRTPLNSILLLSRLMAENKDSTLSREQVEYAQVIQSSGNGLLELIDEILDLSKIEAGKMDLDYSYVSFKQITDNMRMLFEPLAREKGLQLYFETDPVMVTEMETDQMRLEQILKNLLSNAFKFTYAGSIRLRIKPDLQSGGRFILFEVQDSGIGIPGDKLGLIFEAFQQADGSTRRKYGGTGLGLSISRELSYLLKGDLSVSSKEGEGSVFILRLPAERPDQQEPNRVMPVVTTPLPVPPAESERPVNKLTLTEIPKGVPDDREDIMPGEKVILIIEDDTHFATALLNYTRSQHYKAIVAVRGDEGVQMAKTYNPLGILLDIQLPVKNGWEVMEELKKDSATRHIPVHIMSSFEAKRESLTRGAVDFINKPVALDQMSEIFRRIESVINREKSKVLIVEENPKHAQALNYYLSSFQVQSSIAKSIPESIQALSREEVNCVILDMGLPEMRNYDHLEQIKSTPGFENIPIIIFTGKSFSRNEEQRIKQYADSIVLKTAHSYQRILDEVSLFLHIMDQQQKNKPATGLERLGSLDEVLKNKTVLLADDDVRNIFSLTKILEQHKMKIIPAIDGKEALEKMNTHPEVNIVLMDMMMPEMDGFESIRKIRQNPAFRNIPVIAITAKAMMGDREKCIQAGASDYISKPVDMDQLISLLRIWLYEK